MDETTRLLKRIDEGDQFAAEELIPLIYNELRRIAVRQLAGEKTGQSLDATGLVHEAFVRLVGDQKFENRGHFFGAASQAMRRILVERARARQSLKAGGGHARVNLDDAMKISPDRNEELVEVDAALNRLAAIEPQAAHIVQLRFFAGCTMNEAANQLGISLRSANRLWAYAKAWLLEELRSE